MQKPQRRYNRKDYKSIKSGLGAKGNEEPKRTKKKRGALEAWRDPKMKTENFNQIEIIKSKRN